MNRIISIILLLFAFVLVTPSYAQNRGKSTKNHKVATLTPEEILAQEREEALAKRVEEMLANTREVMFIDSLVVGKDEFLSHLRLTKEAGRFTQPQSLFSDTTDRQMGQAAYVNALSSAVYFAVSDTADVPRLHAAYRSGQQWSVPMPLEGLDGFTCQDYPFILSDGTTLYFSAEGDETIGGRDIFATRYNAETRRYVRPYNVGFPFNSSANDYLLAIDESVGIGCLVTDRRQPDDKVCIYWFVAQSSYESYDLDADDEDEHTTLLDYANLTSIAATQTDHETVRTAREQWQSALSSQHTDHDGVCRFVISDQIVYHSLEQFTDGSARTLASEWMENQRQLEALLDRLDGLRQEYAVIKGERLAQQIRNCEVQVQQVRAIISQRAKDFRRAEHEALKNASKNRKD